MTTITVEGREAATIVAHYFCALGRHTGCEFPVDRILVGHWRNPNGEAEEVVVCHRGENSFEVNCHGGQAASEAIIQSLIAAGATRTSPESWLASRIADPIKRAAWLMLRQARTPRTAGLLLDQFRGALTKAISQVVELLERAGQAEDPTLEQATQLLSRLLSLADVGVHLASPWRIVFAGPPNVGKSSLVNAILGFQRAIVFDQPGTTRDVLVAHTALDGWPVELVDTAGLRDSSESIEAEGVARARSQVAAADLVIFVTDGTSPNDDRGPFPARDRCLLVANKCDISGSYHENLPSGWLRTSAKTGAGLSELMKTLVSRLVPIAPQLGEALPFTADQIDALRFMLEATRAERRAEAIQLGEQLLRGNAAVVTA